MFAQVGERARNRVTNTVVSLFGHAPYPLADTLDYPGDPGLFGPGSASWLVLADPAAFVGGLRGLLIQAAHPEVVAGVAHHSRFREDPLGRLSRTSAYITATIYGSLPEVEQAARFVRAMHQKVRGVSSRGLPYDASDPAHAAWVHNALADSFLTANQAYASHRLSPDQADRFIAEQTRVGALLDADPLPTTAGEVSYWVSEHTELAATPETEEVVEFLIDPPLSAAVKAGYLALLEAAVAITPPRLLDILGVKKKRISRRVGKAAVSSLRLALGYSPSWGLAMLRCGEEVPDVVRQRARLDQLTQEASAESAETSDGTANTTTLLS